MGYIPKAWRNVKVVFILKPGKDNYDLAKAFRPISLSFFLLKVLERLVDRYIRDGALTIKPLHQSQHAYQAGKSVETALHLIVGEIEQVLHHKEAALGVFLDIEGAFDNTSFDAIREAAVGFNIDNSVVRWIDRMLKTRVVTATLNGAAVEAEVGRGCPQGGVLSPLLWLLVVDDLLAELTKLGVTVVGYADDVMIMVRGRCPTTMSNRMQAALDLVQTWCLSRSLKVNPGKTEMVLFTRRTRFKIKPPKIFNMSLSYSKEVHYLGVTLDCKLNWKSHISKQTRKALVSFWACRRMFSQKWGLRPKMVVWIYTAILLPQLVYASVAWWPGLSRDTNRRTMYKVYRLAALGATGAMRTTPTLAMGALLGLVPPHIVAKSRARITALRLYFGGSWKYRGTGHTTLLNREKDLSETLPVGGDRCLASYHFEPKKWELLIPDRKIWLERASELPELGGLIWFTDGAKNKNGAGVGIWCDELRVKISVSLDKNASSFQAEVFAIKTCVKVILDKGIKGRHIYICSDSLAALNAINARVITSRLVTDCVKVLTQLSEQTKTTLMWVPGHSGIPGNEEAHLTAEKAISLSSDVLMDHLPLATERMKEIALTWEWGKFKDLWKNAPGMYHTKELIKGPSNELRVEIVNLYRPQLRQVVGFVTGHWHTNKHMSTLGLSTKSCCPRCGSEEETPLHLLKHCDGLRDTVSRTLGHGDAKNLKIEDVGVDGILQFIKAADLLNRPPQTQS